MYFFIILILLLALLIFNIIVYNIHKNFVTDHSILLHNLRNVNAKYHFNHIEPFNFIMNIDNESYYNNVSPYDYLIYQLQYCTKNVKYNIGLTIDNANKYDFYIENIDKIREFGKYDFDIKKKSIRLLNKIEKEIYNKSLINPTIIFGINVKIVLTNINGDYKTSKSNRFDLACIEDVIARLSNKTNNRFNDERIWKSISNVERARVSNKMRFSIFSRDHSRCVKCGSAHNLEIDHIIPISKGGKSTYDNLQTLCKRCNMNKSDIIEGYTFKTYNPNVKYCPKCKAPLRVVNGKYGKFYGCSNYPRCEYREKI